MLTVRKVKTPSPCLHKLKLILLSSDWRWDAQSSTRSTVCWVGVWYVRPLGVLFIQNKEHFSEIHRSFSA